MLVWSKESNKYKLYNDNFIFYRKWTLGDMSLKCKGIFVVGAKRTPFCKHGGPLRELPASHAFAAAAKDAINSANVDPTFIDNTVVGNVHFLSQCDGGKTPRYCGIYSGVPLDRPALGVSKACGSGLQAIITSAMDILTGSAKISLTGGTEVMSALPLLVRNVRFGTSLGSNYYVEDHIKKEFQDSYTGLTMQRNAEDVAKKYGIKREDVDEFALRSHLKWKAAQETKSFDSELTSLTVTIKNKEISVDKDDVSEPMLSVEDLGCLPALLDQGSVVTTGNSAAPADGASALLLADEGSIGRYQLRSLARLAGWACVGVDPVDSGLGAVAAVRQLLRDQGKSVHDVDLFEINETFASTTLATTKELGIDMSRVNVSGGALALGNPVAATGGRMVTQLVHGLSRANAKTAVAASSCGGGQGVAIMLEWV